jgi:predicted transcriptional regulator
MVGPGRKGDGDIGSLAGVLQKRSALLELLADAPRDQRDLRDELGVSRSTVYKALQELVDVGLVAERGSEYALTGFGRLAWQRHDEYIARLHRLDVGRQLIETFPKDRPVPPSVFERGRIIVPGRHAPERPLDRLSAVGEEVNRIRVASPSGMPRLLADLHESVEADEQTATVVVEPDAVSRLRSEYDRFAAATAAEGLDIRRIDGEIPFAVVLFGDEEIGLFGYDAGVLIGAVFTSDDDALTWGERAFDRFVDRSVEI